MSTLMRRAGIGALVLFGLLSGHDVARAQFSFGMTRYGMNNNNPYIAQRQAISNLGYGRLAIASGQQVPASLPYLAAGGAFAPPGSFSPFGGVPYGGGGGAGYGMNPYMGYGGGGYGANPYSAGYGGGGNGGGSNPYSASSDGSNTYSPYSGGSAASSMGMYGAYANPAVGPGYTLMGAADVMRSYGKVITSQEQARILREQYYQAKLDTRKKKFDLDTYIKNNTPTFSENEAKIAKQTLTRIQNSSNPAEIVDGRSLNLLLEDVDKHRSNKTTLPEYDLPAELFAHINIKPAGADTQSLGLLRDRGKLNWPSALVDMLPAATRKEIESRARSLADNASQGNGADRNAAKDLRLEIAQAREQLLKKANYFDTRPYMDAKRFLDDLDNAREAIERGNADPQIQFQEMLAKGKIGNLNDLVKVMTEKGWRFGRALPSDEGAYRALHSALAAYDVALNQQVAQSEP
jgi:hypothetical protein